MRMQWVCINGQACTDHIGRHITLCVCTTAHVGTYNRGVSMGLKNKLCVASSRVKQTTTCHNSRFPSKSACCMSEFIVYPPSACRDVDRYTFNSWLCYHSDLVASNEVERFARFTIYPWRLLNSTCKMANVSADPWIDMVPVYVKLLAILGFISVYIDEWVFITNKVRPISIKLGVFWWRCHIGTNLVLFQGNIGIEAHINV